MFRYTITGLLVVTALVALVCASLLYASDTWATALMSLTTAGWMLATVIAIYGPKGTRPLAGGMATCGWAYFLLVFGPISEQAQMRLVTDKVTALIFQELNNRTVRSYEPTVGAILLADGRTIAVEGVSPARLRTAARAGKLVFARSWMEQCIGHSLFCILCACLGGVLATILSRQGSRGQRETSS